MALYEVASYLFCSGHRIGTAEVESALVSHPQCAEAAVVAVEHEVNLLTVILSIILLLILFIINLLGIRLKDKEYMLLSL